VINNNTTSNSSYSFEPAEHFMTPPMISGGNLSALLQRTPYRYTFKRWQHTHDYTADTTVS